MRIRRTSKGRPACSIPTLLPTMNAPTTAWINGDIGALYWGIVIQVSLASRGSSQATGKSGGVGMGRPGVGVCVVEVGISGSFCVSYCSQHTAQPRNSTSVTYLFCLPIWVAYLLRQRA